MSENYFTGEFNKDQQTQSKTAAAPIVQKETHRQSQSFKQLQSSMSKVKIQQQQQQESDKHNSQQQEQQKTDSKDQQQHHNDQQQFVDAKQISIGQNEQIDQQQFITSNPQLANEQKQQANKNYSLGQYSDALVNYRKSLQYTNSESDEDKKFRSVIYSNIGLTYMKMFEDDRAIQYFKKSLKLNDKYSKARINLGQCYENTDKLEEALDEYKKVLQLNPNDAYVKQKVIPLEIKVKNLQEKRKQQVMNGLKNLGNTVLGYFGMSLDNFKLQKGAGGGYNISFKQ